VQRGQLIGPKGWRSCLQLLQHRAELLPAHQRLHTPQMLLEWSSKI
jgi:hypothetical protein